jgi:hypothetical protein
MVGFKLDEIMTGSHHFTDGRENPEKESPLLFHITWGNSSLLRFLNPFSSRFLFNDARGFITVTGLVNKAYCEGTLRLLYFTERKIRYELKFNDASGKPYLYIGEKRDIWPWNLYRTHVTCYGTITDLSTNQIISESVIYFPYRETPAFLLSFRLRLGGVFKNN